MPDPPPPILIRADASQSIGTGHIMRGLALAGALKARGHQSIFACCLCPVELQTRIKTSGYSVQLLPGEIEPGSTADAHWTIDFAGQQRTAIITVDGYHFLTEYQRQIKDAGLTTLYIDDLAHCRHYPADFVLNQNPSAQASDYTNKEASTELLLGFDYVLLREEFLRCRGENAPGETEETARKILVTMGGGDIDNVTGKVMDAIDLDPGGLSLEVTLVVGAANKQADWLQKEAMHRSRPGKTVYKVVFNASDMPALISQCDLVISAGGTTVWEAAYLMRPTAVIITAENQVAGMEAFAEKGAVKLLGRWQDLSNQQLSQSLARLIKDQARRQTLAKMAARLIDGGGAARVADRLLQRRQPPD